MVCVNLHENLKEWSQLLNLFKLDINLFDYVIDFFLNGLAFNLLLILDGNSHFKIVAQAFPLLSCLILNIEDIFNDYLSVDNLNADCRD